MIVVLYLMLRVGNTGECSCCNFHSNNVRSASNMIPCFPANNSTDVHHCDIVSSRSSPSHFTKDSPFNTSQVRTRSTNIRYKKIKPYFFIYIYIDKENAHAAIHLRMINQIVYLRKYNSQYYFLLSYHHIL